MATILSNGTGGGNWSATTSWSGAVVPVIGDKVNILLGDTITVDGVVGGGDDTSTAINVSGVLKASRTANSDLTVRGELLIDTGTLDYGKSTDIIPVAITATILLNDSATLSAGKWGLTVNSTGSYFVYGAPKTTNTYLTAQSLALSNTVTVFDATGWAAGDTLVIASTTPGNTHGNNEDITILSIVGNVITLSSNLVYTHQLLGRVGNLTKNIIISAFNPAFVSYQNLNSKSATLANSREISQVELNSLGSAANQIKYGGLRLYGSNHEGNPYKEISHIVFKETGRYGLDVISLFTQLTINDCAFRNIAGTRTGFSTRTNSSAIVNRCVVYGATSGINSNWGQGGVGWVFNDCWFITCAIGLNYGSGQGFVLNNCKFASCDVASSWGWGATSTLNNCDVGYVNGLYDGSCRIAASAQQMALTTPIYKDCRFNSTASNDIGVISTAAAEFVITISNKNGDPALQEIYAPTGTFLRDNVTFRSGVASLQAQPLSVAVPLSNSWQVFAPTGQPVVVSGYLRKSSMPNSGILPKVTLSGLGITPSTFTMADVNDTWVQFVVMGTQTTGTDGILTLTAEFYGSASGPVVAWIDGIVAPVAVAVSSGDMGYWASGQPAQLLASNFTSADEVWNKLSSDVTLTGSMGELVKTTEEKVDDNQALIISM